MSISNDPDFSQPPPVTKSRTGGVIALVGGGCLLMTLVCGGIAAMIVFGLFAAIKSSQPYTDSLSRAQSDDRVVEMLGEPIEPGTVVQGSINLNNDDGDADLNYTISGPNDTATVHVKATKTDGTWTYEKMDVTGSAKAGTVNLLDQ